MNNKERMYYIDNLYAVRSKEQDGVQEELLIATGSLFTIEEALAFEASKIDTASDFQSVLSSTCKRVLQQGLSEVYALSVNDLEEDSLVMMYSNCEDHGWTKQTYEVSIIPQILEDDDDTFCVLKSGSRVDLDDAHIEPDGTVIVSGGEIDESLEELLEEFDDADGFEDEEDFGDEADDDLDMETDTTGSGNVRTLYLIATSLESAVKALKFMGFNSAEVSSISCMNTRTVVHISDESFINE